MRVGAGSVAAALVGRSLISILICLFIFYGSILLPVFYFFIFFIKRVPDTVIYL